MNDDELHESFYRSERYKESRGERAAREAAEAPRALAHHCRLRVVGTGGRWCILKGGHSGQCEPW